MKKHYMTLEEAEWKLLPLPIRMAIAIKDKIIDLFWWLKHKFNWRGSMARSSCKKPKNTLKWCGYLSKDWKSKFRKEP